MPALRERQVLIPTQRLQIRWALPLPVLREPRDRIRTQRLRIRWGCQWPLLRVIRRQLIPIPQVPIQWACQEAAFPRLRALIQWEYRVQIQWALPVPIRWGCRYQVLREQIPLDQKEHQAQVLGQVCQWGQAVEFQAVEQRVLRVRSHNREQLDSRRRKWRST